MQRAAWPDFSREQRFARGRAQFRDGLAALLAVDRSRCAGDELRHGLRLRKHRHVAALEDQSFSTHAIRRVPFDGRRNGLVLRGDNVPGRLSSATITGTVYGIFRRAISSYLTLGR